MYGPKYVQAIHGRFLLAATASTMIGPTLLLNLRKMSEMAAIQGKYSHGPKTKQPKEATQDDQIKMTKFDCVRWPNKEDQKL